MNRRVDDPKQTGAIIRYTKTKGILLVYLYLLLMGIVLLGVSLHNIILAQIFDELNFNMVGSYTVLIPAAFFLFLSISNLLTYYGNQITVYDSYITIRKAASGKLHILSKHAIIGKRTINFSTRGMQNKKIIFYLRNGKKVDTGLIYCKPHEFERIDQEFKFKNLIDRKSVIYEIDKSGSRTLDVEEHQTKNNFLFPVLASLPLLIFILSVGLLASDLNSKIGTQTTIQLNGTIIDKSIENNKDNLHYQIKVEDEDQGKEYELNISKDNYEKYEKDEKVIIKGTKGSLGIIYGINITEVTDEY